MNKIKLLLLMFSALMVLGGCVEDTLSQVTSGKEKVEYTAKVSTIAFTSSDATLELYSLYQSPLEYGTASWKKDFYTNKQIIEDNYEEANNMDVPRVMEKSHQKLLSVMEKGMQVNNAVDSGLKTGEKLADSTVKEFAETLELYKSYTQ